MSEVEKVTIILLNREFDRYARECLRRYQEAVVIQIGRSLDCLVIGTYGN